MKESLAPSPHVGMKEQLSASALCENLHFRGHSGAGLSGNGQEDIEDFMFIGLSAADTQNNHT